MSVLMTITHKPSADGKLRIAAAELDGRDYRKPQADWMGIAPVLHDALCVCPCVCVCLCVCASESSYFLEKHGVGSG